MQLYTHAPWPNVFSGYWDLGPILIPPQPAIIGLTDRDTGDIWYLTQDAAFTRVAVDDVLTDVLAGTQFKDVFVYGPNDGPWVWPENTVAAVTGPIKLLVRSGRLGFEFPAVAQDQGDLPNQAKVYTRLLVNQQHWRIIEDSNFVNTGHIGFTDQS